jgi:hypothetical protein
MFFNGAAAAKEHRSFSADGKLMTMKTINLGLDGSASISELVRERKSGTTGLVGEWVNTKTTLTGTPVEQRIVVTGDTIHIEWIHTQQTVDAKLDGSDGTVAGPRVAPATAMTFTVVGPKQLTYAQKLNGKVLSQGTLTLSADGKSYTQEAWVPGKESEKTVQVFEKE